MIRLLEGCCELGGNDGSHARAVNREGVRDVAPLFYANSGRRRWLAPGLGAERCGLVAAAAAGVAAAALDVVPFGDAAEFESFVEELGDDGVELLDFVLCGEEVADDGAGHEFGTQGFELLDFVALEFEAVALFVVQEAAEVVDLLEAELEAFVAHEGVEVALEGGELGCVEQCLTEAAGAFGEWALRGEEFHGGGT